MSADTNKSTTSAPSTITQSQTWPRRHLWFGTALILTLVGSVAFWISSVPPDPLALPMPASPLDILYARRGNLQTEIHKLFDGTHLRAFTILAWITSLPLSVPILLAWIWRKKWLLRVLSTCALLLMTYSSYRLIRIVVENRMAMSNVATAIEEIQRNLPKAKAIRLSMYEQRRGELAKFSDLEQQMNEPAASSMFTLTTLDELRKRQKRIHEAVAAGETALALYREEDTALRFAYQKSGINSEGAAAQAVHELRENGTIQDLDVFADEPSNIKRRLEICQIHLKILNLTERIWSQRHVDTKAHKIYVDKFPIAVDELNELQKQLRAAQDELEKANSVAEDDADEGDKSVDADRGKPTRQPEAKAR